jgi:RecB family exonuclease
VQVRPARLSLTEIETLIRDPYAIYARHLLRLRPLPPLRPVADARLRGEVLHKVPEAFLRAPLPAGAEAAAAELMRIADAVLAQEVPWPGMRAVWRARMAALARPFAEAVLEDPARPVALERKYAVEVPGLNFTLVGKPDRLDLLPDGRLRIVDYKTGALPTKKQQAHFARQLHLAAVMAALGAFPEAGTAEGCEIVYVALKADLKELASRLSEAEVAQALEELRALVLAWREAGRGFTSRRAMEEMRHSGDYDDLARFGEWGVTDGPVAEDVG